MLTSQNPPAAVFCVNDLVGFGVQAAAYHLNIQSPDQLWVVGYDDIAMSAWERINLTSVRQPIDEPAHSAVDMLTDRIADPGKLPRHRDARGMPRPAHPSTRSGGTAS